MDQSPNDASGRVRCPRKPPAIARQFPGNSAASTTTGGCWHDAAVDVEWPDQRGDVLAALELLASEPPLLEGDEPDPRWPDLTNAIHWPVDDTVSDIHDPIRSIGTTLRDEREAAAMRRVGRGRGRDSRAARCHRK